MDRLGMAKRASLAFCFAFTGVIAQDNSAPKPAPNPDDSAATKPESVLFEALPMVEAASLHAQSLLEAPASVTVITEEEIRRRGYRTMADVLADVRGMYVTYDRAYHYVGVRGFSLPGDASNRFLVMINGHSLSENLYGSANLFGQDFGLDLDLVKRIEIVRGPSSALYGTNGMFATINIVTKSPVDYQPFRISSEFDTFGERKGQASGSVYLGGGANLIVSGSVFNNTGQSPLYFPAFDTPQTNHGLAIHMDGERGYHTFANLIWGHWSFTAYFNNREKVVPTGWFGTIFNDRGDKTSDGRNFLEASYQRDIGTDGQLRWRIYYDQYRFWAGLDFPSEIGTLIGRNVAQADWIGTELTYRFRAPLIGFLTLGGQADWDLRAHLDSYYLAPIYQAIPAVNSRDRTAGLFFQDERSLGRHWTFYLGGRFDDSRIHQLELTPRAALIYHPSETSALKLLFGRSFRNPSPYEQFYQDGVTQIANLKLASERMQTFEAAFEKQIAKRFELQANVYHYRLTDLIQAVLVSDGIQQYRNTDPVQASGVEFEARANLLSGFRLGASLAFQDTSGDRGSVVKVNSPARIGKILLDSPVWRNHWSLSGGLQYLSRRLTLEGSEVSPVYLVNVTAVARRLPGDLELSLGIQNLFNYRYWDPAGTVQEMASIQQNGRSCFVRLSWAPERKDEARVPKL
ncbi:MAG TPA: TonB-dependent receptor [Bryobacteraceae bacterium]|nr:TonB-dependent receptor [Bryobacteraceae bacterium]